jgi:mRNA interferase MazF
MTIYEFGDVVLLEFPFTDQTGSKKRPAVAVSSRAHQTEHADVILLALTSQTRPAASVGEVALRHWQRAGLLGPSVLKPILFTVERRLVARKLGRLTNEDIASVRAVLAAILG